MSTSMSRNIDCLCSMLSALALSLLAVGSTLAADSDGSNAASAAGNPDELGEIVVTSHYQFLGADTSGTTGLPVPIEKVPQSISLVSGDFVKAADLKTLGEIAEYTPGAINVGNALGLGSLIDIRGFTAGRAIDGIEVQGLTNFEPDYAIVDRLEIVKGPASLVYGVASPGGLVNYVTKSATPQTKDYLLAQAGSWGEYRVEGQVAGSLDANGHVRAIAIADYDHGDSFMNVMSHTSATLYGGVNVDFTDGITGYLHAGYQRFTRTGFDGIPTEPDGSPAPLARSFFIGAGNMEITTNVYHSEGNLTWHATDMLELSLKGNLERTNTHGYTPYSDGLQSNGDIGLTTQILHDTGIDNNGIGLSGIYHFDDLGLKNSFVSLAALYQTSHEIQNWDFSNTVTGNIFNGEASLTQIFESLLPGPFNPYLIDTNTRTLNFSAQSVLQIIEPLSVLMGVSYAKPNETQVFNGISSDFSINSQISYRGGITYEIVPGLNSYISYSQSFNPQTLLAVGNTPLPPLIGEQYETGLKYRSSDSRVLLTGAVFKVYQKNQGQYATTIGGLDYYEALGEVTHSGVELEALGRITRDWQINAGYAYLDPKVVKDSDTAMIGQTELYLPKQTASIFSTYTLGGGLLKGLSFGGGGRYVAAQRTAYDDSTRDIPGYVLVDLTFGYTFDKWSLQLNAHNIFDRHYFINNYQTLYYGNQIGEPTNLAFSVRRDF
jgi:TonB-dependent siderophore receptor